MENVLVNKYGEYMIYDTESNSIVDHDDDCYNCFKLIRMKKDGQVITPTEVIDVNAGDIISPQAFYSAKEETNICKIVVIHDPAASYDLEQIAKLQEKHNKVLVNKLSK